MCRETVLRSQGLKLLIDIGDVMKRKNLQLESGFRVVLGNRHSQAAEMALPPGDAEASPQHRHRAAAQ